MEKVGRRGTLLRVVVGGIGGRKMVMDNLKKRKK